MILRILVAVSLGILTSTGVCAADRQWENPVFQTAEEAVAAAREEVRRDVEDPTRAGLFFVDLTLAAGDLEDRHPSSFISRFVVGNILVTHPTSFEREPVQQRTVERFLEEVPRQSDVIAGRLSRFGYPGLPGMVYLRLVESVDAFSSLNQGSSDRMSRVGGVTYYCRYVVLPLSYVSREGLAELRRSGALSPSADVEATIRQWQNESFASLVNTFRHELVHVHTNSALGVPSYSNRVAYPTWFHEGTATYLAADPHAGLSQSYQEYQEAFFYLAQRFGIRKLQAFYASALDGTDIGTVLDEVYALSGADQLFAQSRRWHRAKEVTKTALWIVGLVIVVSAFRGAEGPFIGALQLLAAIAVGLALATGLSEHLYGLRGPGVVMATKIGIGLVAVALAVAGGRRVWRWKRSPASQSLPD